jgi:hypothetical protein
MPFCGMEEAECNFSFATETCDQMAKPSSSRDTQ